MEITRDTVHHLLLARRGERALKRARRQAVMFVDELVRAVEQRIGR